MLTLISMSQRDMSAVNKNTKQTMKHLTNARFKSNFLENQR